MSSIPRNAPQLRMGFLMKLFLSGMITCFAYGAQNQQGGSGAAILLPDGPGKAIVQSGCVGCHDLERITKSTGGTRDEWQNTVNYMISQGAKLTKDQAATAADYRS